MISTTRSMGWKRKKGEFPEFNRNLIKTIFTRIEQTGHFAVVYSPDSHRMPVNVDMSSSDPIDLRRLKKLEPEVVSDVHSLYFPELYRYAYYRIGDTQLAEDLASDVLLKLLEAVKNGHGPKKSLRGWLMGTASNLINEHYRKSYKRPTTQLFEEIHDLNQNPVRIAEEKDEARIVRKALQGLTPDQQHVIALRFSNEYSLEETANIMGKNVNAIKALQFRAISALKKEFEKISA
jgi:RNA polymerase sigma-70 factor (ECF subfamily)